MEKNLCKCVACGQIYENWAGSTPCCGSLTYILTEKDFRKDKIQNIVNKIK